MILISRYSSRCDLYDVLVMIHEYTEDELKNNIRIYIGNNSTPLKINSKKDLIPYYGYLISYASYNNKERTADIHLSSKPSVDFEEEGIQQNYLRQVLTIYNRCKRKKTDFNVEDTVKEICGEWNDYAKKQITEIANRVKEKGKKATLEDIHFPFQEHHRQNLVNEMIKNGLNPADYGYARFIKESENSDQTK